MKPGGRLKDALYLAGAGLLAFMLLALFGALARQLTPAFRARLEKKAASAPLRREARKLGLTYEAVLAAPAAALGKPVLWCMAKRQSGPALYGGLGDKPVLITNPEAMPSELYQYPRRPCADALLEITSFNTYDYGGARAVRVEARFIDYP